MEGGDVRAWWRCYLFSQARVLPRRQGLRWNSWGQVVDLPTPACGEERGRDPLKGEARGPGASPFGADSLRGSWGGGGGRGVGRVRMRVVEGTFSFLPEECHGSDGRL